MDPGASDAKQRQGRPWRSLSGHISTVVWLRSPGSFASTTEDRRLRPGPLYQICDLRVRRGRARCRPVSTGRMPGQPGLNAGADTMRRLDDHPDSAGEPGGWARASVTATHDATAAVAWFGDRFGALTDAGAER